MCKKFKILVNLFFLMFIFSLVFHKKISAQLDLEQERLLQKEPQDLLLDLNRHIITVQKFTLFFNDPYHQENEDDFFKFRANEGNDEIKMKDAIQWLRNFENSVGLILHGLDYFVEDSSYRLSNDYKQILKAVHHFFNVYYKAVTSTVGKQMVQREEMEGEKKIVYLVDGMIYKSSHPERELLNLLRNMEKSNRQLVKTDLMTPIQLWENMKGFILIRDLLKQVSQLEKRKPFRSRQAFSWFQDEYVWRADILRTITFLEFHLTQSILPFITSGNQEAIGQSHSCLSIKCDQNNSCQSKTVNRIGSKNQTLSYEVFHYDQSISLAPGLYCLQNNTKISVNGKFSMDPLSMIKGKYLSNKNKMSDLVVSALSYGELLVNLSDLTINYFAYLIPEEDRSSWPRAARGANGSSARTESRKYLVRVACTKRLHFIVGTKCIERTRYWGWRDELTRGATNGQNGGSGRVGNKAGDLLIHINRVGNISGDIFLLSAGGLGFDGGRGGHGGNGPRNYRGNGGRGGMGGAGGQGGSIRLDLDSLTFIRARDKIFLMSIGGPRGYSGWSGGSGYLMEDVHVPSNFSGHRIFSSHLDTKPVPADDGVDGGISDVFAGFEDFMDIEGAPSSEGDGSDGGIKDWIE